MTFPAEYIEGVRLFNEEDFYECHDVWEELWADVEGEGKRFLQGMIQASVALFHFGNENLGGARKLYTTSMQYLDEYRPAYMGVDLEKFREDMQFCFQELLDAGDTYPKDVAIRDERVPKIELTNDTTGADE